MATVEVTFTPLPAHVRTARLVAIAVARRSGVPDSMLDEVRLAVGEACSRAVEAHTAGRLAEPIRVGLSSQGGRFEIEVAHSGVMVPGHAAQSGDAGIMPHGFSLAVIAGLADDVQISETATGTIVKMSWPLSDSVAAGPAAAGSPA